MDFSKIKAFAFDIDGVATDGGVFCNSTGDLLRTYDAKDGFAIRMAVMNGYPVGVITGGSSESIRLRMATSGVKPEDVYLHSRRKMDDFDSFCRSYGLAHEEVMFFGDDVPDMEVMAASGCGVCPSDAVEEVKAMADWVSPFPGGHCCLRNSIETVLRSQGKWNFDAALYKKKF
ncbi:MAG: HAD hydrolase family protein [Bacteroidales bacterium]|nr:HAD hydrolase family protein [Bacteroidales bacterium]